MKLIIAILVCSGLLTGCTYSGSPIDSVQVCFLAQCQTEDLKGSQGSTAEEGEEGSLEVEPTI